MDEAQLIPFPLERRYAQIAEELGVEVKQERGLVALRIRPDASLYLKAIDRALADLPDCSGS